VFFYEQSALTSCLKSRKEGLNHVRPVFHSYLRNGPRGPKLFAHVAVLEHLQLNTNRDWKKVPRKKRKELIKKLTSPEFRRASTIFQNLKLASDGVESSADQSASTTSTLSASGMALRSDQLARAVNMIERNLSGKMSKYDCSSDTIEQFDTGKIHFDKEIDQLKGENIQKDNLIGNEVDDSEGDEASVDDQDRAQFIFHAAGDGSNKLLAIKSVLQQRGITLPRHLEDLETFVLLRSKSVVPRDILDDK
jgi:hypothetical protein